ncbi:type II toxin-antitoxin system VapB family antitoxin [Algoriphagus boritolerans]
MRTNIDIDEELIKEAMKLTGIKTKKRSCRKGSCAFGFPEEAGKD